MMGAGTQAAGTLHAKVIDDFKDKLLVALLKRLGPNVTIPIAEVDATGDSVVTMQVDQVRREFVFEVRRKQ